MWQKIIKDKRLHSTIVLLLLLSAIPATLYVMQQNRDIRQHAATVCSETGNDTILIIDKSNSMNAPSTAGSSVTRFQKAKEAAKLFADLLAQKNANLPEEKKHRLAVVSFSNSKNSAVDATLTTDMNLVKQRIDALKPGDGLTGWTCIECGVNKANAEFTSSRANPAMKNVAILLTDGIANWIDGGIYKAPQETAEEKTLAAVMEGHNTNGNIYYTIGLGTQEEINEAFLQKIATDTDGKYYYSATAEDLANIYKAISQILGRGAISGIVFDDANGNKTVDPSEQKLPEWTVSLINTTTNATLSAVQTNANGEYSFTDLCEGPHQVELTLKSGWTQTTPVDPAYHAVTVTDGTAVTDKNFGVKREPVPTSLTCSPSTVSLSTAQQEITATLKDANGTPLSGRTITWTKTNDAVTINPESATTNSSGVATTKVSVPANTTQTITDSLKATYAGEDILQSSTCSIDAEFTLETIKLSFSVFLHGIGNFGDNPNPTVHTLSNKNPLHKERSVGVQLLNSANETVTEKTGTVVYDQQSGSFKGTIELNSGVSSGSYILKLKSDQYLIRRIPGIQSITAGQTKTVPTIDLVTGDVNVDNTLNILDYNTIIGCYSDYAPPVSCDAQLKRAADLTDDGKVNQFDYNLFLRDLSIQFGD